MEITYTTYNGYQIPDLTMNEMTAQSPNDLPSLTRWGRARQTYLRQNKPITYTRLLTSGHLLAHLLETQTQAQELQDSLLTEMMQRQNLTEQLKAENPLLWTQQMNNLRQAAAEIVQKEIIES